jgi:hypothetical protein
MVKPLYPLSDISPDQRKRMKDAEKARKEYILSLCKNPYIISVVSIVLVLVIVIIVHSSGASNKLDTSADLSNKNEGSFSFLKPSKYFSSSKTKDIGAAQKEQLKQMGIDDHVESMGIKVEAKNLREERKILAMRKYEASRQTAERRIKEKEEHRQKLNSATSLQLKDAVMAAEDSGTLGIMKLEGLLKEKLLTSGGDRADLDVYIFAYERLAKAYENKNMEEKAKEAYLNAFKLMKVQAPESQGPDWDTAIGNVEQINARPTR